MGNRISQPARKGNHRDNQIELSQKSSENPIGWLGKTVQARNAMAPVAVHPVEQIGAATLGKHVSK